VTAFSNEIVVRTRAAFEPARQADRAPAMSAYMRGQFPFFGLPTSLES
jgi:hypothetical protein